MINCLNKIIWKFDTEMQWGRAYKDHVKIMYYALFIICAVRTRYLFIVHLWQGPALILLGKGSIIPAESNISFLRHGSFTTNIQAYILLLDMQEVPKTTKLGDFNFNAWSTKQKLKEKLLTRPGRLIFR